MTTKKECFGTMFPDLNRLRLNEEAKGKVFRVTLRQHGLGAVEQETHCDVAVWEKCHSGPASSPGHLFGECVQLGPPAPPAGAVPRRVVVLTNLLDRLQEERLATSGQFRS